VTDPRFSPLGPAPEKPVQRRFLVNDATTEAMHGVLSGNTGGVLNYQDEMSGWFASFDVYRSGRGGKDQSFWLQTDNGGEYNVDRRSEDSSLHIPNLSCCFTGSIQPDKLLPLVKDLSSDGFLQRSHVIYGRSNAAGEQFREENAPAKQAYETLIRNLSALDPASIDDLPIRYGWPTDAVRHEIEEVAAAMMVLPTTPEHLRQHLAKWRGKVSRLMLLFHIIECVSRGEPIAKFIEGGTAERVKAFMLRFLLPNAMRFYDEFFRAADRIAEDARWIAGHVLARKLERITAREICRAYSLDPKAEEYRVTDAMNLLSDANWVGVKEENPAKRSISWPVNPRVHVLYADRAAEEKMRREFICRRIEEAKARVKEAGFG
jgi:hypothetical protein